MDINKVWLSGRVITQPTWEKHGSKTPITRFFIAIREKFKNKRGEESFHTSAIPVESLGRSTEKIMDTVQKGGRYMVDGYLRHDRVGNREDFKVRTFAVYPDESMDQQNYVSGLSQALHILENSMDLEQAKDKIAELLRRS